MKILAIIVTYNGMQWYDRCFSSLETSTIPLDIYVVDNASSDGTAAYIKTNFPSIHLIESPINLGFGQANNKGMRYALDNGYDYVFLLNQDAWLVQEDAMEQLLQCHINNPTYGILSPLQLYGSGQQIVQDLQFHMVESQTAENDLISDLRFSDNLNEVYNINYICAASWFMHSSILKEIGGFDPIFFHYGEDNNYMQRINYHGYAIGVCPQVSVCHDIEYRSEDYGSDNNNCKKYLIVECADINVAFKFKKLLVKNIILMYSQILMFKFKAAFLYLNIIVFLFKKRNDIQKSRVENKSKGFHWLVN